MWHHFLNFLFRTWQQLLVGLGTTTLAVMLFTILAPSIILVVSAALKWWKKRESPEPISFLQALWEPIRSASIATGVVVFVWVAAYGCFVVRGLYDDHQQLVARKREAAQQVNVPPGEPQKLPTPTSQSPKKELARTATKQPTPQIQQPAGPAQSPPVYTQPQTAPPQTQLERLIAANRNLSKKDRDSLSDDLHAFSDSLIQGRTLMYKCFQEGGEINTEGANIANDFQSHATKLHDIAKLTKEYAKSFMQLRTDADYFREQTEFVFGDNPDNLGPNTLTNAVESFAFFLEKWGTIANRKDESVLILLSEPKNLFQQSLNNYSYWNQGCLKRLEQMRASLVN